MQPRQVTVKNGHQITLEPADINGFIPGDPIPEGVVIEVHCGWDFENGASEFGRGKAEITRAKRAVRSLEQTIGLSRGRLNSLIECIHEGAPLFAAWHRAQARAMGTDYSLILAWEGKRIVSFLSFYAIGEDGRGLLELPVNFCPYMAQSPDAARRIDTMPIEKMAFDTITISCAMSVAPRLKRHGIATAMLRYLIDLAREQGWKQIRKIASLPESYEGFVPPTTLFEGVGFHQVGECLDTDGDGTPGYEMHLDL